MTTRDDALSRRRWIDAGSLTRFACSEPATLFTDHYAYR